uniref:Uncharacterized monothiol glutaredoxin F10D7.3-like n=1 Tax=Saccoglossus kowalevskii TaxID=10224 RepID=A0ABM0LUM7_SACKO|nr:PREDICTED: uncharacterized monothiol glutaredoxin F10D7.3-like [Saccoglossus kowalevskii]
MTSTVVESFVDAKIEEYKVVVFSKSYCPRSRMTKAILSKYEITMEVIEIDVPRVFFNGECIGGESEVTYYERQGTFEQKLKDAGAL